jgi:hypothetical protein
LLLYAYILYFKNGPRQCACDLWPVSQQLVPGPGEIDEWELSTTGCGLSVRRCGLDLSDCCIGTGFFSFNLVQPGTWLLGRAKALFLGPLPQTAIQVVVGEAVCAVRDI